MTRKTKVDYFFATGKRKRAIARAKIEEGKGKIMVNSVPLSLWSTELSRLWIKEPLEIAGEFPKTANITINVKGGGVSAQAESVRIAISKALVKFSKDKKLKKAMLDFDRNMLVYDPRRTEPHHGHGASKRGSRRHKQRSKR